MAKVIFNEMSSAYRSFIYPLDFNISIEKLLTILNIITHYYVSIQKNASAIYRHKKKKTEKQYLLQNHLFINLPMRFDFQPQDKNQFNGTLYYKQL